MTQDNAYTVVTPIEHGQPDRPPRRFEPGERIELSDEYANPLLASGAIEVLTGAHTAEES